MRIDLNSISLNSVEREEKPKKAAGKQSSAPSVEDKASLSVDTLNISSLKAQALASPEIRQDKVEALRQQVQNGQYKVDPDQIAKAILKHSK